MACFFALAHVYEVLSTNLSYSNQGSLTRYEIVDQVKYGAFSLLLVAVLALARKEAWKQLFTLTILLSFTPLLKFSNSTYSIGVGPLDIDLLALVLLLAHLIFNKEALGFISKMAKPGKSIKKDQVDHYEASVQNFTHRFRNKSQEELQHISTSKDMTNEAREAAKRLLNAMEDQ